MYKEKKERKNTNYLFVLIRTFITIIRSIPQLCVNAWNKNIPNRMNKSEYEDLAPNKSASNSQEYFRALDLAISNPAIKNIALTGPYGAGKSSVICSYLDQRPTIKALHISLATFAEAESEEEESNQGALKTPKKDGDKRDFKEDELEKGILKQLFYKVNYRKIPQSRYRKIHKHGLLRTYGLIVILALYVAFGIWFWGNDILVDTYKIAYEQLVNLGVSEKGSILIIVIFVGGALLMVAYLVWLLSTRVRLGGLKIADKVEVSAENKDAETVFNKNLDEIIYFFESTDYDVVFVEDLDRFRNNEIFIKLRELNTLINNYEMIKRKIVFVYAVRDDMFENTDRTKFFDFIIPIIPYINSTNSAEIMRSMLGLNLMPKKVRMPEISVSDRFVTLVAPYISDMRVLTSIMNEFWIYIRTIKGDQKLSLLHDENMLALMIFKNMFPREFANLEGEEGIVKQAFRDKKTFIEKKVEPLEKVINQNLEILKTIDRDILRDVSELKVAFLGYLVAYTGIATNIQMGSVTRTSFDILKEDFDFNSLNVTALKVIGKSAGAINNTNLFPVFNDDPVVKEYFIRYNSLVNSADDRKEALRKLIEEYREKVRSMSEMSLAELINEYSVEEVLSSEVQKNDLLKFFLRHGYIDENYANYINYFHPQSITTAEMNYILGIRNHKAVGDYTYGLEHCDRIIDRLEAFEFEQIEILNFDLLDHMLENLKCEDEKFKRLIKQITNRTEKSKDFIKAYIERNTYDFKLIPIICHESNWIWFDFDTDMELTQEAKDKYLLLILKNCEIDDICRNEYCENDEVIGKMKTYLERDKDILIKFKSIPEEKFEQIIEALEIEFNDLTMEGEVDKKLLDFIFDNNHYVLNKSMVEKLFMFKVPERSKEPSVINYTAILDLRYAPLLNYVHKEFARFATLFMIETEENDTESLDAINDALERLNGINTELCIRLIEKQKNAFWDSISDCLPETGEKIVVWNYLLENKRISITWDNYIVYHAHFGFTDELCNFVNNNMQELINAGCPKNLTEEMINELLGEDISIDSFEMLLDAYRINSFSIEFAELKKEKLQMIIEKRYIPFSVPKYRDIWNVSTSLAIQFAVNNKTEFIEKIDECQIIKTDVSLLIKRSEFEEKEILKILKYIAPEKVDQEIALRLREFEFALPKDIVNAAWNCLDHRMKLELLYNQLEVFSLDELAEKFRDLGGVYKQFEVRKRKKFELGLDDYNKKLCQKLLRREFITSCNEEDVLGEWDPVTSQRKKQKMLVGNVKQKENIKEAK